MFSIEDIYGVDFGEFCKQTYTTPDLYIQAIRAEIEMLEKNYEKQRVVFESMLITDKSSDRQEQLVLEIQRRLKKKKSKLKKYKRYLNEYRKNGQGVC